MVWEVASGASKELGDEFAEGVHRLLAAIGRHESPRGLTAVGWLVGGRDPLEFAKLVRDELPQLGQLGLLDVIVESQFGQPGGPLIDDRP